MPNFGRVAPTIPVSEMERALRFYCDVLGFAVSFTNGDPVSFAIVKQGKAQLHLAVQASKAGSAHAHVMVDDVDEVYQRVGARAGGNVRQPPTVQPWGLRDIVITDPDGNSFEIAAPAGEG